MMRLVRCCATRISSCWIARSERVSSADVASSNTTIGGAFSSARDRDALPLAARQAHAALADARVIRVGQPLDERVELRAARGRDDFRAGRVALAVADVVRERVVEQDGVLRHDAERVAQAALGDEAQILAVDADDPGVGLVEPEQQPREASTFPEPLPPTTATDWPGSIRNDTSHRICRLGS
jgi:hypothetical protein